MTLSLQPETQPTVDDPHMQADCEMTSQDEVAALNNQATQITAVDSEMKVESSFGPGNLQESLLSNDTSKSKQADFETSSQAEAAPVLCQDNEETDSDDESDSWSYVTAPESEFIDRGICSDDDDDDDESPIPTHSESPSEEHVVVIAQPQGTAWRVHSSAADDDDDDSVSVKVVTDDEVSDHDLDADDDEQTQPLIPSDASIPEMVLGVMMVLYFNVSRAICLRE